jgi:ubiquinone/menaquinone biosynthesis C-methylase UbiE
MIKNKMIKNKIKSEIIRVNKVKWDEWADTGVLENNSIKFLGLKIKYDFNKFQSMVVDLIDIPNVQTFLDIGCGTGWAMNYAFNKFGGKGEFYGIDLSQKMIDKAIQLYKDNQHLHFVQGESTALPYVDNLFDVIMSTNAFHHFPDPDKALSEICRVLKPGGKLLILDPTADGPFSKIMNFIGHYLEKELVKIYSTKQFRKMFAKAGLEYLIRHKEGNLKAVIVHIGIKKNISN